MPPFRLGDRAIRPLSALRRLAPALIFGLVGPASAAIIDMGDCRLDTVTFVDPAAGGSFVVERVGRNVRYLCAAGPADGAACAGPFGDLVLYGTAREPGQSPRKAFAVWHSEKAAPCCGWRVLEEGAAGSLLTAPGFRWLDGAAAPRLGDVGFASIYFDEYHRTGSDEFSAPKIAMRCAVGGRGDQDRPPERMKPRTW